MWWICLWHSLWWWFHECALMSKLKLQIFNMYSFLHVNHTHTQNLQRKTTPPQIFSKGTDWTTFNSAFHYHLYCLQIVSHFNLILIIHIPPQKYIWRFSLYWEDWILLDKLPTVFLYDHNFMTAVKQSIVLPFSLTLSPPSKYCSFLCHNRFSFWKFSLISTIYSIILCQLYWGIIYMQ